MTHSNPTTFQDLHINIIKFNAIEQFETNESNKSLSDISTNNPMFTTMTFSILLTNTENVSRHNKQSIMQSHPHVESTTPPKIIVSY